MLQDYLPELRLLQLLALTAVVALAAWRWARRANPASRLAAAGDAVLILLLVQYLAVGIPGLLHLLYPVTIGLGALAICGILWWSAGKLPKPAPAADRLGHWPIWLCGGFLLGYAGAFVYLFLPVPVTATDALVYHLPAAAQWLQHHRIDLYPTWFFNPANTFSPLAGSVWMAWYMAPLHNDLLARFAQCPAYLLAWLALMLLCRQLGAAPVLAALLATTGELARPIFAETILPKDDLQLTALFLAALAAMARQRYGERCGPVRLGVAVGLMLAVKFTALLALLPLLLMIDVPIRAGWKKLAMSIAVVLALAGPWYLRNMVLTGNPVFPLDLTVGSLHLLRGPLSVARSSRLASCGAIWQVLSGQYYSPPPIALICLAGMWLAGLARSLLRLPNDPLARAVTLGVPFGLAVFVLISPYAEVRFVDPMLMLMVAAAALALRPKSMPIADCQMPNGPHPNPLAGSRPIRSLPPEYQGRGKMLPSAGVSSVANHASWNAFAFTIAIALCLVCLYTDFLAKRLEQAMPLQIAGIITGSTAAVLWLLHCLLKRSGPWFDLGVVGAAILVALGFLWVNYQSDLEAYRTNCDDPQHLSIATNDVLGEVSDAWLAVRNRLHPGDVVAYANFAEAYPLMGFDLSHPVIYCPARPDVDSIVHIPTLPRHLSGEQIDAAFSNALLADSDEATWLTRLAASHARWLVIRAGDGVPPPELRFVADHPAQFNPIPGPSNFRVYQIRP